VIHRKEEFGIPNPVRDERNNIAMAKEMLSLPNGLYMAGLPNFPRFSM
jgi:hypothetical protein